MLSFSEWSDLMESSEVVVSGPGIDRLRAKIEEMGGRGAPIERNDYGFGHGDYTLYQRLEAEGHMSSEGVPVRVAGVMLRMLSHYANTQVPEFRDINAQVKADVDRATGAQTQAQSDSKAVVYDRQALEYGKIKVYVPGGIDRSMMMAINRIIDEKFRSEGAQMVVDRYGKETYPRFKRFSADKSGINLYRVHRDTLADFVDILKGKGIEVEYESGGSGASAVASSNSATQEPDVTIIGKEKTDYGDKLAVKFAYEKSKGLYDRLRASGLMPKAISWGGSGKYRVNIEDKSQFDMVVSAVKEFGLDPSALETFASTHFSGTSSQPREESDSDSHVLSFRDEGSNLMSVRVDYRGMDSATKEFIKECIQYTFPEYKWHGPPEYKYVVKGNYKQYVTFGRLLKKFKFNVDELRDILKSKTDSGLMTKTPWEGRMDKDEGFMSSIDKKFPDSDFDLYDEQKFGIAFLYGRDSAILGDSTGLGKTIQLIKSAELRMRESNKPTLIVTLKSVQKQFMKEIVNVMGDGERDKISSNPLEPKKWTVLYYENFSSGKNLEQVIDKLSSTEFGIVIFDELHKIKHGKTKRSTNIYRVIEKIPTRWGASATVSSNKPMDVKNQLEMIGHHLGKVDRKKFARDFAGAESYGGSDDKDEREIVAAERLNKWLNLSGVYVRREKGEVRKMPEMRVEQSSTTVDPSGFQHMMAATLSGYKNPDLPVSRLIAAREAISRLKTGETTRKVLDIVSAGKDKPPAASKVVVFTNFVGAAQELVERIRAGLKDIDPSYRVITYLSNTKKKERDDVKRVFTDDPNAKVLVMSMRMGGTGIDFPNAAQNMVINDFDWTPEAAEQSEGRIYRINTEHPVDITYVVGQGLDRDLFERVRRKREIAAIIQRYRREYHETDDKEALKKIVAAQKEIKEIDKQMAAKVAAEVPGAEGALEESFRSFLEMSSAFLLG